MRQRRRERKRFLSLKNKNATTYPHFFRERMSSLRYIVSKDERELYNAADRGDVGRLKELLRAGVCPNVRYKVGRRWKRRGERESEKGAVRETMG